MCKTGKKRPHGRRAIRAYEAHKKRHQAKVNAVLMIIEQEDKRNPLKDSEIAEKTNMSASTVTLIRHENGIDKYTRRRV